MHNKFNIQSKVIVNGIGKCNGKIYKNQTAIVINRDPFFMDYNVRFKDGTEDWLEGECLKKFKGEKSL